MTAAPGAGEGRPPGPVEEYASTRREIARVLDRLPDGHPAQAALVGVWRLLWYPEHAPSHTALLRVIFKAGELIGTLQRNGELS